MSAPEKDMFQRMWEQSQGEVENLRSALASKTGTSWRDRTPTVFTSTDKSGEKAYRFGESDPDNTYLRTDGPVHGAFGLTYASYLVIPRLVLSSMPIAWQQDFVALLRDLDAELRDARREPEGGYTVHARDGSNRFVEDPHRDYRHGKALTPKCFATSSQESGE